MILTEEEAIERISSPLNLLNRLKKATSPHKAIHPSIPPSASELIPDLDEKVGYGSAKSKAMRIMDMAMTELQNRVPEIQKPETLARVAENMGKVISNLEVKNENDKRVGQIIIYAPTIAREEDFDVIDARSAEP